MDQRTLEYNLLSNGMEVIMARRFSRFSILAILFAVALAAIIVSRRNHPPMAVGCSLTVREDTSVSITLVSSDPDGDSLTYTVVTGPSHGSLSGTEPNLIYTPKADFSGPGGLHVQ